LKLCARHGLPHLDADEFCLKCSRTSPNRAAATRSTHRHALNRLAPPPETTRPLLDWQRQRPCGRRPAEEEDAWSDPRPSRSLRRFRDLLGDRGSLTDQAVQPREARVVECGHRADAAGFRGTVSVKYSHRDAVHRSFDIEIIFCIRGRRVRQARLFVRRDDPVLSPCSSCCLCMAVAAAWMGLTSWPRRELPDGILLTTVAKILNIARKNSLWRRSSALLLRDRDDGGSAAAIRQSRASHGAVSATPRQADLNIPPCSRTSPSPSTHWCSGIWS